MVFGGCREWGRRFSRKSIRWWFFRGRSGFRRRGTRSFHHALVVRGYDPSSHRRNQNRSTAPPFHALSLYRSTVPPFHRSTVPPFHRSTVPPFHRAYATCG